MKKRDASADKRISSKIFPAQIFLLSFLLFALFTTSQMKIIQEGIDVSKVTLGMQIVVLGHWVVGALVYTLVTRYQIRHRYEKPVEEFAKAARQVANGDFSVYVPTRHTADKMDYLDVIFTDFNTMTEELGSIETLKTDFFSNVSHEIKTPLAVIQSSAELLRKEGLKEEQRRECTETILQASKRLSDLITNMLKLNKLEKQAIKPIPTRYDVCQQLCECALQFEEIWEEKDIEFAADIEDRAWIEADRGLMEIVWNNLLSNAMKFTAPGGTVTLTQTSVADRICVTVADTGCGMNENTMKHIFDKFYQGDVSHSTEGNGLGLALVKRVLELSGGTISAESAVGKGTSFSVTIPVSMAGGRDADRREDEG